MKPTLGYSRDSHNTLRLAWEEFITTGNITQSQPRSVIANSWQYSRQIGIDPSIERAPTYLEPEQLDITLNHEDLGKAAKPVLDRLDSSLHNTNHVVVLANAHGHILYSIGHQAIQSKLEAINFMPGGSWSVDEVGPNGVGTPIKLNQPELVNGIEHYCEAWQPWACYGSPIHDNTGQVIGCVDITGPAKDLSMQTMSLAISIAQSVETGLNLLSMRNREILRISYQQRKTSKMNTPTLLVDELGTILDFDPRFACLLGAKDEDILMAALHTLDSGLWQQIKHVFDNSNLAEQEFSYTANELIAQIVVEPITRHGKCLGGIIIINKAESESQEFSDTTGSNNLLPFDSFRSKGDQMIRDALEKTNGNISKAARLLGINRTTIYRRLKLLNRMDNKK